jgi:hypothetical protein
MGLKRTIVKLLVHKLAPRIFRRLTPSFLGRFAPRLLGKSSGRYGYAKYQKPKSRGWLGGLKKLLKKLT